MGTEINYKNSFPGYYSMRNANEDSVNNSWHHFNTLTYNHYYDGFTSRTVTDTYSGQEKDGLKRKMLQHEAVLKNQVYELHRLYNRQRDMMEEVKRKDIYNNPISIDTSSFSSFMPSHKPFEDANRWQNPSYPVGISTSKQSIFGAEISHSSLSCTKENVSKDCEAEECRPSKVRRKLFDLQLPAHEYIEPEEADHIVDSQISEISSYAAKDNRFLTKSGVKTCLDDGGKKDGYKNTASDQPFLRSKGLADLNEPVYGQDVDFFYLAAKSGNGRSNMNHTTQCYETSTLRSHSNTMHHLHGKEVQHHGIYPEISSKTRDHSQLNQTALLTSQTGNAWDLPWGRSNDSLTNKSTVFQIHPSLLSSQKSHEVLRDKCYMSGNRFYNGSSSGSKDAFAREHSIGFDYRNGNKLDAESQKIYKGSSFVDLTGTTKNIDLNCVRYLSDEDHNSRNRDQTVPPWLKAKKVICKNGDHSSDVVKKKDDSSGGLTSASVGHRDFDINVAWDDDDDDTGKQIDVKKDADIKNQFDLNSCVTEDDDLLVTESYKSSNKKTMEIDLEAPAVSEIDEEDEHKENELNTDHPESTKLEMVAAEVIVAISGQHDHVGPVPKAVNDDDNNNDPLLWFVDVINSYEKNIAYAACEIDEYEMLTLQLEETEAEDYMPTPLVPDFQEQDDVDPDSTCGRPRRGQTKRGRPRRDFQKDILPGMTCLSRQEITEDLQVFGGLMRATGHSWNLGFARKNGKRNGGRGRRKVKAVETPPAAIVSPPPPPPSKLVNSVEGLGLDERSLTRWGKTTRRPGRQRYAAGNSVAVQLT